ncbi:MAG: hypothetical protein Ct9H90mP3_6940 [Flammeovirgaceae bacterium]|nr:MAG: hypothetical protein Ct9H90mP3_6940 [Flammeovirgaceae bacterium]
MSDLVDKFIDNTLTKYFDLPIVKIDERLTSKILNNDSSKRNDDLSAVKLLETYSKMHSFYYQNRILMYVAMTILIIIFALIFAVMLPHYRNKFRCN